MTDLLGIHRNFLFDLVAGVGSWAEVSLLDLLEVELQLEVEPPAFVFLLCVIRVFWVQWIIQGYAFNLKKVFRPSLTYTRHKWQSFMFSDIILVQVPLEWITAMP